MTHLRKFTPDGCRALAVRLEDMATTPGLTVSDLLTSSTLTEIVSTQGEVPDVQFQSRRRAAEVTVQVLLSAGISDSVARRDVGIWAWLSAYWIDSLAPELASGVRRTGQSYRWIPDVASYRTYYRHLLLGPYSIYKMYEEQPEIAMCVLGPRVDRPGDTVEQLASRQEIATNPQLLATATHLYWSRQDKRIKTGAGGSGPGSPRRFADVYWQFDRTWDFHEATKEKILELLPKEFDRFR